MRGERGPDFVHAECARRFSGQPRVYQAPGRINLIGEHTDYNGGLVLPAGIDLFTWAALLPRRDRTVRVRLCQPRETHHFSLDRLEKPGSPQGIDYVKGVAWALQDEGFELEGCDLVISGSIPLGGGLSSSASLQIVLAFALLDRIRVELEPARLARICHRAETEFVGVQCGIMDQYAIAMGKQNTAMLLDCATLGFELLDLPPDAQFVVVHSGVKRQLRSSSYNSRRAECAAALRMLQAEIPQLKSLGELDMRQLLEHRDFLPSTLMRRCRHVVSENARVQSAVEALRNGDLAGLGKLLGESHASLRDDYEVSCSELDQLVDMACNCPGVLGARMMGAGFGGCTLNLVTPSASRRVMETVRRDYGRVLGREPWMHAVRTADGVKRLDALQAAPAGSSPR